MTKQEQFLWIVQTCMLANAINLASDPERRTEFRHEISATGMYMNADEAVRASEMIPANMTASDASHDFVFFMCSNLREGGDSHANCPSWFARG